MTRETNFTHFEAERALIATLFHDETARAKIYTETTALTGATFANKTLALAFVGIQELFFDNQKPELFPLLAKIEGGGHQLTAKERDLLSDVCATQEATAEIDRCVQIVLAKHTARQGEDVAHALAHDAASAVNPESIDTALSQAQQQLSEMQDGLLGKKRRGAREFNEFLGQAIEVLQELNDRDDQSAVTGIPSGIKELDEVTTGWHEGELIVIGGRPSMGKTAMGARIMDSAATYCREKLSGAVVTLYSMEMPGKSIANRFLAQKGRIDMQALRTGKLQDEHWDKLTVALGQMQDLPIMISEEVNVDPAFIRHDLRIQQRKYGKIGLVIVDYLQLMEGGKKGFGNRTEEVSGVSRDLKRIAGEFKCPVVALSQLNRGLESRPNKRPIMSDLRESGGIEQDADVILFLYRDEVYNPDSQDRGLIELILSKQRNGPLATVRGVFHGEYASIENYASGGQAWSQ
jgi:replicative DNA helicase